MRRRLVTFYFDDNTGEVTTAVFSRHFAEAPPDMRLDLLHDAIEVCEQQCEVAALQSQPPAPKPQRCWTAPAPKMTQ